MGNSSYLIIGKEFAAHVIEKDHWRDPAGATPAAGGLQVHSHRCPRVWCYIRARTLVQALARLTFKLLNLCVQP